MPPNVCGPPRCRTARISPTPGSIARVRFCEATGVCPRATLLWLSRSQQSSPGVTVITNGFRTSATAWPRLSASRGLLYPLTLYPMFSWVARLVIRSAVLRCCASRPLLALAMAACLPEALLPQLSTGLLEGSLRDAGDHPVGGTELLITGALGFRTTIHTMSDGSFVAVLPYGTYRLSDRSAPAAVVTVSVAPLETVRLELVIDGAALREQATGAETWRDHPRDGAYPEAFSLQGVLLSREPSSVSEPLDLSGLSDNRLTLESQRGYGWTATQYKLQGIDATDSWQPGRPLIEPDIQAVSDIVAQPAQVK